MPKPYQLPPDAMVSEEGPQQMGGNPLSNLLNGLMGPSQEDIQLPSNGPSDPRILQSMINPMLKANTQVLDPIGGLKKALGK